jgi:DNA-binding transcriptional ArsR family regulator
MSRHDPAAQDRSRELTEARELRTLLKGVGDLVRLQILRELSRVDEMSVTELAQALHISQPLVSWHLGVLRRTQVVTIRREGRLVWYALHRDALRAFVERLEAWLGQSGTQATCRVVTDTFEERDQDAQKRE